jgi:hypothetical protein
MSLAALYVKLLIAGACSIFMPQQVKLVMNDYWLDKSWLPDDPVTTRL